MKKVFKSKIGNILLESDGKSIVKCELVDYEIEEDSDEIIDEAVNYLKKYLDGEKLEPFEKVTITGTAYQVKILKLVQDIEYGDTVSYSDIKDRYEKIYNKKTSSRAVGHAIGSNKIIIFVPCHRVVGKNGNLTGYKYGLEIKNFLLNIENVQ